MFRRVAGSVLLTLRRYSRSMATRTYQDAVAALNSLQSNAAVLEALRASGGRSSDLAMPEMIEYLGRIGYTPDNLNKLNVLHVTGTKGKGSTCAFCDSLLRQAVPSWKIGLYTSPHLVAVRERIRINGAPLSEEEFAKYFFEVWDRLEQNTTRKNADTSHMPGYFRFVTLMAFHTFTSLKVDATILEVGVGGTYDSTNIVPKPIVTGITSLGLDHTNVLGKTLKEIAWQKGGIFKEGVPAFTVPQPDEPMEMLRSRAAELRASVFTIVPPLPELSTFKLGLAGSHQIHNANLAVHLSHHFLLSRLPEPTIPISSSPIPLSASFIAGLEKARWPGRCQKVTDPKREGTTWFLDGAHTVESLKASIEWYVSPGVGLLQSARKPVRVLIFNCTSGRSGRNFLATILENITSQLRLHQSDEAPSEFIDHVMFCTNVTYADGGFKGDLTTLAIPENDLAHLITQNELAAAWSSLVAGFPSENIHVLPSIEHAIRTVRNLEEGDGIDVNVYVAGSLHLVGGVIEVAGLSEVALSA